MVTENIETNVVLTADNAQYDQSMVASAQQTEALGSSIDSISQKLSDMSKGAGRKFLGISAADVATITAAAAATAAYDRQMSQLSAQAATLNRTMSGQVRTFDAYQRSVKGLRAEFGTATSEAAQLTQQIAKMADRTTSISSLTRTFIQMSNATGESSQQLASSVLNLGRVMGTPQRDTQKYADALASLSANSGTTASALADFSSQLAPVGRLLGMSQTDIMGVSKAFATAGQDGYRAATSFNKIVSDIAYATQTGSPDLAKYSNLIGMTVEQFDKLSGTEKIINIFDQLNRMGPRAITELNRMGLDGMNMVRSITAVSQQSGGIGAAIREARGAVGSGASERGSEAAMRGMTDEFSKLRSEAMMTAEVFGGPFAKAFTEVLERVEKATSGFRALMEGPLGDFLQVTAAAVAPITGFAGGLLLMAGALTKVAAAALALRGSGFQGLKEGWQGGSIIQRTGTDPNTGAPMFGAVPGGQLGERGQRVAERGSWFQRAMYNTGARAGILAGVANTGGRPLATAAGATMGLTGWAAQNVAQSLFSPAGFQGVDDPTRRYRMFQSPTFTGSVQTGTQWLSRGAAGALNAFGGTGVGARAAQYVDLSKITDRTGRIDASKLSAAMGAPMGSAQQSQAAQASARLTKSFNDLNKESGPLSRGFRNLSAGLGSMMGSIGSAAAGTARWGAQGVAGIGGSLMRSMGGANLAMLGLGVAAPIGLMAYDALRDKTVGEYTDLSGSGRSYMQEAGITAPPIWQPEVQDEAQTMESVRRIEQSDIYRAKSEDHKLTNQALYGMDQDQVAAYLSTQWEHYQDNIQARQAVTLDLIDKFDETVAGEILGRLDAGEAGGIETFFKRDSFEGLSNEAAARQVSGALGIIEDMATAEYGRTGGAGAQRVRTGQSAQALQGFFQAAGRIGGNDAEAFNAFSDMFGGLSISEDDLRSLLTDLSGTGAGAVRMPNELAAMVNTPLSSPEAQAGFLAKFATELQSDNVEGAEEATKAMLADFGAATDINLQSQEEIYTALLDVLTKEAQREEDDPNSLTNRIRRTGATGAAVADSVTLERAAVNVEDIGLQYRAIGEVTNRVLNNGKALNANYSELSEVMGEIGDESDHTYQIVDAARQRLVQTETYRSATMSRGGAYASQGRVFNAVMSSTNPLDAPAQDQAGQAFIQQTIDQANYFRQMLMQQRQFDISRERAYEDFGIQRARMDEQYHLSRERAQQDFHLQREYQEYDYQLGRQRAEDDYNLQRQRGQEAFTRSMHRGQTDFNISRRRQEEDYQHQVMLMTEQAARQIYNIYERVNVQRTSSARYLMVNAQDQLERMEQQSTNLDRLRRMGVSDDAIQQMGFTDPANAQQLARFVSEVAQDPDLIRQLNTAIRKRLRAARELTQDESSQDWQEFTRQYELATSRAQNDFERSVRRARRDFRIQMNQMEDDFRRSMNRQAEDYETAQDRQQKAFSLSMSRGAEDYARSVEYMTDDFHKSMRRAQEDMDLMAQSISGNFMQIMRRAMKELRGTSREQAREVLETFQNVQDRLGNKGVDIMEMMSDIFGFKYNAPKRTGSSNPNPQDSDRGNGATGPGFHAGGVLPGRSIGRDNMHYYSPQHGELHLAGGEAIMVPEWVDMMGGPQAIKQMNYQARYGAGSQWLAQGGTVNPSTRVTMDGEPLTAITKAQLLLAEKLGKMDIRVMQGSFQPYTSYSGSSHMGAGVADTGPGNFDNQYWQRRVGFAAWGRNFPGAASAGSGAHIHAVSRLDPGARNHAQLSSFARGEDGLGGRDYGPNPPMLPNLLQLLGRFMNLAVSGGDSPGSLMSINDILKDTYPEVERAAAKVRLGGGLFKPGFWSDKINSMARTRWNELSKQYTPTDPSLNLALNNPPSGAGQMNNQELVRKAAEQFGWAKQWAPLYNLVMAESGFRNTAQNPTSTAYGMFQFLDSTWAGVGGHKTSDPWLQAIYGMRYIKQRYGGPAAAWNFHQAHNWYRDGAIFSGAQQIGIGEHGPEMVLPLNGRGTDFLADLMSKTQAGSNAKALTSGFSTPIQQTNLYQYSIDRSTTFTGAITVQANNPAELIAQLRARQAVQALSQPVLAGRN